MKWGLAKHASMNKTVIFFQYDIYLSKDKVHRTVDKKSHTLVGPLPFPSLLCFKFLVYHRLQTEENKANKLTRTKQIAANMKQRPVLISHMKLITKHLAGYHVKDRSVTSHPLTPNKLVSVQTKDRVYHTVYK